MSVRTINLDGTRYDCELEGDDGAWGFKRVTPEPDDATYERLCDENERLRLELQPVEVTPGWRSYEKWKAERYGD